MDAGLKARIDLLRLLKLNPLPASGELVAPMRDVRVTRDLRHSNRSNGSRLFADASVFDRRRKPRSPEYLPLGGGF